MGNAQVRTSRRGSLWVTGERVKFKGMTAQKGQMFVEWEAPQEVTQPYPVVIVHGGLLQGTEWFNTPDGRPGWAQRFVEAGYPVLIVDRPGHGRSHTHPGIVGPVGDPFSYEDAEHVFFPPEAAKAQTQLPFDPKDEKAFDEFVAPFGPLPADLAISQQMDADCLARLIDKIGPAIILTHSASGSDGWLLADRRKEQIVAIVTVEPMGPAFADTPGLGKLSWGITAAPIKYDPPRSTAEEVSAADPSTLHIPSLEGIPVAVVSGETSVQSKYAPKFVDFLNNAGAVTDLIHLPDYGILGNGHG